MKSVANTAVRIWVTFFQMVRNPLDCATASIQPHLSLINNQTNNNSNMKLLFDLFPILLFFIAFKLQGIYVATAVAIAATLGQIIWSKFKHGKVDKMLWISFAIVGVFGGATLVLHDESFIKFKPSALYWLFAIILLVSNYVFRKNLMRSMLQEKIALPMPIWNRLNLVWGIFFGVLGFINLYVAYNYSTDTWVTFKLFGFSGMMLVFILGQGVWLSKYLDEKKENN
jgi:intracellular septation protein